MSNQDYYSGGGGGGGYPSQPSYNGQQQGYNQQGYGQQGGYPQQQQYSLSSSPYQHQQSGYQPPNQGYNNQQPSYGQQQQYGSDNQYGGHHRGHSPQPSYQSGGGSAQDYAGGAQHQQQYHNQQQPQYATGPGGPEGQVGPDGERGLGATLVGGGGAAWAAHKAGGGFLGTAGAAIAGAIGANVLEHAFDKKKKKHGSRGLDDDD